MDVGNEDMLRLLLELVPDYAIFMLDPHGIIISWNPAAQRMKGYTEDEAVGRHFRMLYVEEDARAGAPEHNLRVAAEQGQFKEEGRRRRKSGEIFQADIDITPLWTDDGVLRGFGKVVRDITERKRYERLLATSEERAWRLIDSATAYAIIGMDLEGKVIEWNEGAKLLFGYDRSEVPGRDLGMIFVPEERAAGASRAEIETAFKRGSARDDRWHARKDGTRFFGSGVVSVLRDRGGKHIGYAKVVRDLTDQKLVEEDLRRASQDAHQRALELIESEQRLMRSNQELERFSAIVSHDLREPLRMIDSYLTLLERRHAGQLDEKAREFLTIAVDGAKRAQRMVNGLHELNRVGRIEARLRPVALNEVYAIATSTLGQAIAESGARVTRDELPIVLGDKDLLANLFQNLIANALKYVAPGVRPIVKVGATDQMDHWRVTFADNGIGIGIADQERIFRPLERLHGPEQYAGSGLGLAICATIASRLHGRIWVESRLGAGCSFHLALQKAP